MRTFLTYVLAALAATVVSSVAFIAEAPAAGSFGRQVVGILVLAVSNFVFLGAAWKITNLILSSPAESLSFARAIYGGALSSMAIGFVAFVALLELSGFLFSGEPTLEQLTASAPSLWASVLKGAAWGTVFWIRAPKPTTAGIAA